MSSGDLVQLSEVDDGAYSLGSEAYHMQEEEEQQGNKEGAEPELSEKPKEIQDWCNIVDQPRTSQQPQTDATSIDLTALQEYISRLPDALVPEFALLLAQRMKQHVRDSNLREQDGARAQAESFRGGRTQTGEHAAQPIGRCERPERTPALRYIVTPHPSNTGRSIKQSVGEPENIPYLPPGVYRETVEGTMELESSFRRSVVEQRQEPNDDGSTNPVSTKQGWLRKMMSKVLKRQ